MSTSCRRLDDVALWSILKAVDASTLQTCRRVSSRWNGEIHRLNDHTSKFQPNSLIIELCDQKFKISVGTPNGRRGFEENVISSETVRKVLRHVDPPHTLLMFLGEKTEMESFEMIMKGVRNDWICNVKKLEIVSHNPDLPFSKVLNYLGKTPNLVYLSLSHHCNETVSIREVVKDLPQLRHLRIFGFNSNDGTRCSSGLIFDNDASEQLLKNQEKFRKIQSIELFNTDITVSMDVMMHFLRKLARLPFEENLDAAPTMNLLFDRCDWESIDELDLLSSIIRSASKFNYPTPQPDINILKGDFKFSIFETDFLLKLMAEK